MCRSEADGEQRDLVFLCGQGEAGRFGLLHAQFGGGDLHIREIGFGGQPGFGLFELAGGGGEFEFSQGAAFHVGQRRALLYRRAFFDENLRHPIAHHAANVDDAIGRFDAAHADHALLLGVASGGLRRRAARRADGADGTRAGNSPERSIPMA